MREIGLVKTADGYRQLAAEKGGPELASVVDDHMQDIRVAQNLVVLKTSPATLTRLPSQSTGKNWTKSWEPWPATTPY